MRSESLSWKNHTSGNHDVPILEKSEPINTTLTGNFQFTYDLIANIYAHLARIEESNCTHPDEIDLNIEQFILYKYDRFMVPVVDIIVEEFQNFLEEIISKENIFLLRKALYPEGQPLGVALTHDVDIVRAYHPLKKLILKVLIVFKLLKSKRIKDLDAEDQSVWGFDGLLKLYKTKNWKASFFFMAKYREELHFRYRISTPQFKNLFKRLKNDNHEIGLHPSRYAFDAPRQYEVEKRRLEKYSGCSIKGLRHHYLRCLFPQIWNVVENLEMDYDASMIYRRNSGFRAGTTSFYPVLNETSHILECPTHFFENTLPEQGQDIEKSLKLIRDILALVKKFNGIFVVLWHTNNLYAHQPYPDLWRHIIKLIEAEQGFIATIRKHIEWTHLRNSISLTVNESTEIGQSITLKFFPELTAFTLILPKENLIISTPDEEIDLKQENNMLYIKNLKNKGQISLGISHGK
jgi:hypothetical protein